MRGVITRIVSIVFLVTSSATVALAGDSVALNRILSSRIEAARSAESNVCSKTTRDALRACRHDVGEEYWIAVGKCRNLSDSSERNSCMQDADEAREEALELCSDQREVRDFICEALGEGPYDPQIDPNEFSSIIDNSLLPFIAGTVWTYEGETEEGLEVVVVEVLDQTREVMGVECIVVRDRVYLEGNLIEDTDDWYAQDLQGNVWYFGEISYEVEDGVIVSLQGSWEAGEDGAKPGIVMLANPTIGQLYRQEFLLGEAEDVASVEALNQSIDVVFGSFDNALQTREFLPISPDALEFKYFVPGIGFVLEIKPDSGERLELVGMTNN